MKKRKLPRLDSRPGKYLIAKAQGMPKTKAMVAAGYAHPNNVSSVENSLQYQELEKRYFKDELLAQTTLAELGMELLKNVRQDDDRGAKNKAIELALSRLEPEKVQQAEDKVLVILK